MMIDKADVRKLIQHVDPDSIRSYNAGASTMERYVYSQTGSIFDWIAVMRLDFKKYEVCKTDKNRKIYAKDLYDLSTGEPVLVSHEDRTPSLSRYEQETVINYNNEERQVSVYTCDPYVMRRLDKLVHDFPDVYRITASDAYSKTYSFDKKYLAFRRPVILTDEQRAEMAERFKQHRMEKNKS